MRVIVLFLSLTFLAGLAAGAPVRAVAQEVSEDVGEDVATPRGAATLDDMFDELRRQTKAPAAQRIARQIWNRWTDSGSATINLLMEWAGKAMQDKDYAVAEDLLTQVTTLAPDYAEGWNRRATLYFAKSDYGRSIADIERVLQLEPRHFGALAGLGMILDRTGSREKALETWYKVLAIYPANSRAQSAVVKLEEKLAGRGS